MASTIPASAADGTAATAPGTSASPRGDIRPHGVSAAFTEIYDSNSEKVNTAKTPYNRLDILYVAFVHIDKKTKKLDFESVGGAPKSREAARLNRILALTSKLRAQGKLKVVISLGYGDNFNDIPLIEANLGVFAPSVASFVRQHHLDGFDIDYETPRFSSNAQFRRVSTAIRAALGPRYLFTITPNNTEALDGPTLSRNFNYVNVQSYRAPGNMPCPITNFTRMKGLVTRKITAGADVANSTPEPITNATGDYLRYRIGGVFAWQITPNFAPIANKMWAVTHLR